RSWETCSRLGGNGVLQSFNVVPKSVARDRCWIEQQAKDPQSVRWTYWGLKALGVQRHCRVCKEGRQDLGHQSDAKSPAAPRRKKSASQCFVRISCQRSVA